MSEYKDEGFWDKVKLNSPSLIVAVVAILAIIVSTILIPATSVGWVGPIVVSTVTVLVLITGWKMWTRNK